MRSGRHFAARLPNRILPSGQQELTSAETACSSEKEKSTIRACNLVCGDAQSMEFQSKSFDLVYCRMLLQY